MDKNELAASLKTSFKDYFPEYIINLLLALIDISTKEDEEANIIDNLTTPDATKALSANQGVVLKALIDALPTDAEMTTQIQAAVAALVNGAPATLDTLKEIADALEDNPQIIQILEDSITTKVGLTSVLTGLADGTDTPITAASTILQAFANLQAEVNARTRLSSPVTGYVKQNAAALNVTDTLLIALGKLEGKADEAITLDYVPPIWSVGPDAPIAQGDSIYEMLQKLQGQFASIPQVFVGAALPGDITSYPDGTHFIIQ